MNNGQSAWVFLEFTLLLLPLVLSIVLPISAFAAVLYASNRLFTDSEIVVMFAAGLSGTALLRSVLMFASLVLIAVYMLTLYLMPMAQRELRERVTQVRSDIVAAFIREGAFLNPMKGVTVYLRETGGPGEMFGIFVHDERDPDEVVTYTAERALLLRDEASTRLVMFDGIAQSSRGQLSPNLSTLRFTQFAYDLTQFDDERTERARKPSELFLPELLSITAEEAAPRPLGDFSCGGARGAEWSALCHRPAGDRCRLRGQRRIPQAGIRRTHHRGGRCGTVPAPVGTGCKERHHGRGGRMAVDVSAATVWHGARALASVGLPHVAAPTPASCLMRWTLALYIARRFLSITIATFLAVFMLVVIVDLVELMRANRRGGADFGDLIGMALLHAPSVTITAAPFTVLLSAMMCFALLARSSELVVTRAAGVSAWRLLTPAVVAAGALGVFAFAVYNPAASAFASRFELLEQRYFDRTSSSLAVSAGGLWLRQGGEDGQTVIRAKRASGNIDRLWDVSIFQFDPDDELYRRINARTAVLQHRALAAQRRALLGTGRAAVV